MRLVVALALGLPALHGQTCAPSRLLPAGVVSGSLDDSSCRLSDGTAYAAYRLDLPIRGRIEIDLASDADLAPILRDASGAAIDAGRAIHRQIEAGTYTLLVNARTPGASGAYAITTAFSAAPGMLCSGFPSLGLNQTAAAVLGASGCFMPDGTPYEAYTVRTFGAGTLNVSVSSAAFTTSLIVRGSDGRAIGADAASVAVPVDGDSAYQVVVATADGTGGYQVATSFQPADTETCRAQKTFSGPDRDTASITGDGCSAVADDGTVAYYKYYGLTVTAAGLADLAITGAGLVPTLALLDDGGNALATANGQPELRYQLGPGNYTVQVFGSGSYTLAYSFSAGAPQPYVPVPLNPGDSAAGALAGPADLYSITLPTSGTLGLEIDSGDFNPTVAIHDGKDNLVVASRDGSASLAADLPAGAYTIVAASAAGAGAYRLTSTFAAHDIAPCGFAQGLAIDGGYIQRLGPRSCRGANGQPVDIYEFTLPADGAIAAVMTSSEVDGYLTLTDAAGNVLRTDDNSYGYNDPLIVDWLPAGTYRLAARAASATNGGYYEVDLRSALGPRPGFCAPRGSLARGGSVTGSIDFTGCQYTDSTFADIYRIDLPDDGTIDLTLVSGDFDAYLVLLDAKGNLVDEDDNSGGGTDARLNLPLSAGTYFVAAKPSSDYFSAGSYTLSLAP